MFSSTEEIIADIGAGRMVIIVDDEDRENEGDLVMAASRVTAPDINYMSLHGRGLICLTVTPEHCRRLRLPLMVADTNVQRSTNFTVSSGDPLVARYDAPAHGGNGNGIIELSEVETAIGDYFGQGPDAPSLADIERLIALYFG